MLSIYIHLDKTTYLFLSWLQKKKGKIKKARYTIPSCSSCCGSQGGRMFQEKPRTDSSWASFSSVLHWCRVWVSEIGKMVQNGEDFISLSFFLVTWNSDWEFESVQQ